MDATDPQIELQLSVGATTPDTRYIPATRLRLKYAEAGVFAAMDAFGGPFGARVAGDIGVYGTTDHSIVSAFLVFEVPFEGARWPFENRNASVSLAATYRWKVHDRFCPEASLLVGAIGDDGLLQEVRLSYRWMVMRKPDRPQLDIGNSLRARLIDDNLDFVTIEVDATFRWGFRPASSRDGTDNGPPEGGSIRWCPWISSPHG